MPISTQTIGAGSADALNPTDANYDGSGATATDSEGADNTPQSQTVEQALGTLREYVNGDRRISELQGWELKKISEAAKTAIADGKAHEVIWNHVANTGLGVNPMGSSSAVRKEWQRRKALESNNPEAAKAEAAARDEISERTGRPKKLPRGKPFKKGSDKRRNATGQSASGEGDEDGESGEGEGGLQDMSDLGEAEDTSAHDGMMESLIRKIARQEDYKVVKAVDANFSALAKEISRVAKLAAKGGVAGNTIILAPESDLRIEIDGHAHEALEKCIRAVRAGFRNILLVGPSGSGKTTLARQLAKALAAMGYPDDYAYTSCSVGMTETVFVGRMLPVGENGAWEYIEPDHVRIYENGGVFLCDEIDASDANVMVSVNGAWENGEMYLPARHGKTRAVRHPQCIILAAANTWGHGADRMYVGRNQLDAATLRRFKVRLSMDYDRNLEKALCGDKELLAEVWRVRDAARAANLRRVWGTGELVTAAMWRATGMSIKAAVRTALADDWSADDLAKIGYAGTKPAGAL